MRVKKGDIVEIIFFDHVSTTNGVGSLMECVTYGKILAIDKKALYVASWLTSDIGDFENMNTTTILKTAIKKISILKRPKTKEMN